MHCCACERVCYHVNGPFYCAEHRPASKHAPACQHCYCGSVKVGDVSHVVCCNCGNKQKARKWGEIVITPSVAVRDYA